VAEDDRVVMGKAPTHPGEATRRRAGVVQQRNRARPEAQPRGLRQRRPRRWIVDVAVDRGHRRPEHPQL
jgi:hypothetical protein